MEALLGQTTLKRIVNVSSFSVYSMTGLRSNSVLDESCPLEDDFVARGDAYGYAKRKQDDLVSGYRERYGMPVVTVRPSVVIGPGRKPFRLMSAFQRLDSLCTLVVATVYR
jgi:nucleoside-diphosphate-sugar epimerase